MCFKDLNFCQKKNITWNYDILTNNINFAVNSEAKVFIDEFYWTSSS